MSAVTIYQARQFEQAPTRMIEWLPPVHEKKVAILAHWMAIEVPVYRKWLF
ncbi:hypothetical protein [Arachidicoccus terrestris]|uniref:hypothetical protein n=1 Tax=Arachidicoccus terrestris TaxID=2875539 RepID=UPI001CC5D95A|nr:hypothetical protein [Arachidicoccus terrestris]UAY54028.1 hypothetical protein K9M52_11145 [Arachidicoccus terrestris]